MKTFTLGFLFFLQFNLFAQTGINCSNATPFCTGTMYNFPLATNNGSGETGPDYTCLYTQPNPTWFYLFVYQPGNIDIHIQSTPSQYDVDFTCWGPFNTLASCGNLTSANTVDCSYSSSYQEDCNIPNAIAGKYYIFIVTNYSNQTTNVAINQTNSGTGAGSANCSFTICNFDNITYTISSCDTQTNQYCVGGNILYHFNPPSNPITTGTLTIVDQPSGISQTFNPPFTSPTSFNLCGILSDGLQHTLTATFSDAPSCSYTVTYTAPASCSVCFANAGNNMQVCGLQGAIGAVEMLGDVNTHWIPQSGISYGDINNPSTTIIATNYGSYNLAWQVTNSYGLTCIDTVSVSFQPTPMSSFLINSNGLIVNFTNTSTSGTYNWDFGNGYNANIANPIFTYSTPGTYNVCLTLNSPCGTDTYCQNVTVYIVNVNNVINESMGIFPNPASDNLNIVFSETPKEKVTVELFDNIGQKVAKYEFVNKINNIILKHFAEGMYYIKVKTDKGIVLNKIMINKN